MNRLRALFLVILALDLVALLVLRSHPLKQPGWYDSLLTIVRLLMCWGGVEGARWLLRDSPASRCAGPESDWTRLWLWLGPPGGALLAVGCVLGWWIGAVTGGVVVTWLLLGHFVAGSLVWLAAAPWAVPMVLRERAPGSLDRRLLNLGMAAHAAELCAAIALVLRRKGGESFWNNSCASVVHNAVVARQYR